MRLTTAYLLTLNKQDVFDVVAWQMLRQNAQSIAPGPGSTKCMYRAPDGKRCAVGWLIPDEVYQRPLEFLGVRDLAARLSETTGGARFATFLFVHMPLLRDLQGMHDANPPAEWAKTLRMIAQRHNLNDTVVDHMTRADAERAPVVPVDARRLIGPAFLLDLSKIGVKLAPEIETDEPEEIAW